jgi:putative serine protease PepD
MALFNRSTRTLPVLALAVAVGAGGGAGAAVAALHGGGSTQTRTVTATSGASAAPIASKTGGLTVSQIYQQVKQGVVDIKVTTSATQDTPFGPSSSKSQAEGSGFVIDKQGDIVTNDHVVSGASAIQVTFADGTKASAKVVGTDRSTDLAVVRVTGVDASKLQPVSFGDSSSSQVGDGVVAIGSPFGLADSVTTGVVSALGRTMQAPNNFTITGAIQTDAAINHGNSGGPLLNSSGQVIGVNAQIESNSGGSDGVGFAIPSNTVKKVAQQLLSGGKVTHAYLGVELTGTGSPTVASVKSGSPAANAGLKTGDAITAIDGQAISSSDALITDLQGHTPGDKVTLTIRRGGTSSSVDVTLAAQPT